MERYRADDIPLGSDDEPIWWYVAPDLDGNGLSDLLICQGEPDSASETGTWRVAPNLPKVGWDFELAYFDTDIGCSVYDKMIVLDHDGDGLASLLVIPVWEELEQSWIPSSEWGNYQVLRLDPEQGWLAWLEDSRLPPDLVQRWRANTTIAAANANGVDDDFPYAAQGLSIDRALDANGDGLPDLLRYELLVGDNAEHLPTILNDIGFTDDTPSTELGGIRLWLNDGTGFRPDGWVAVSDAPGTHFFRSFQASAVFDYNADGLLDLLKPDDDGGNTWVWYVYVSEGDGNFTKTPVGIPAYVTQWNQSVRAVATLDVDGDGLHDPALLVNSNWDLYHHEGAQPDQITRIQNGLGEVIDIDYRALTDFEADPGLYSLDDESCFYPRRCERRPQSVVERHYLDSGKGGYPREFEHRWTNSRSDREGRRWLGFDRHDEIEWAMVAGVHEPIHRRTVFYKHAYDPLRRAFPTAHLPTLVQEDRRDPVSGKHLVTSVASAFEILDTSTVSFHPYVDYTLTRSYELPCPGDFCEPEDLDISALLTQGTDSVSGIDTYANVTHRKKTINTGKSIITYYTQRQYDNDAQSWLLGQMISNRVIFTQAGLPLTERYSEYVNDPQTGEVVVETVEPLDPELFLQREYTYEAHGNLSSWTAIDTEANVRGAALTWDDEGVFLIARENALGHVTEFRWHPGLGALIERREPTGVRHLIDHDGLGLVTGVRTFAGLVPRGDDTTFSYVALPPVDDGPVLRIKSTTGGGAVSSLDLDRLGRPVVERWLGVDDLERYVSTTYDLRGRLTTHSLTAITGDFPPGYETWEYDYADRPTRHILADGAFETWIYHGLVVEHRDFGGTRSRSIFDRALRLIESRNAVDTPDEEVLCFNYGVFEQLVTVRPDCVVPSTGELLAPGEAPATVKTFAYDRLDRLIGSHDPSEGSREYVYNGHGELSETIDGNDSLVVLERDDLGRIIARTDLDGVTTWIWDTASLGALTGSMSPDGHGESFGYDDFGRLTSVSKIIAGETFDIDLGWDALNRIVRIQYPQGDEVTAFWAELVYADNGELRQVRNGPEDVPIWTLSAVDAAERITREEFGGVGWTERSWDPLRGFAKEIQTLSDLGGPLQHLRYTWSPAGTLSSREDLRFDQSETMAHDHLHRMIVVETVKGMQASERHFAYDALGNLVFATDRGDYDYDGFGRLAFVDGHGYEWDGNGNLLARTGPNPVTLEYTAFDKVAQLVTAEDTLTFEYDADHARVLRYSAADKHETIYVTDLFQRHTDQLAGTRAYHYYVHATGRVVAEVVDEVDAQAQVSRDIYYVHDDHLGSTDVVSDASGTVAQRMSFDAWGLPRDPEDWTLAQEFINLSPVNLGYTGHAEQRDGGFIDMGGRLYDPRIGRMASADPFVVAPTSTQGWNRYAYVLNRPLALTDPSGFTPEYPDWVTEVDEGGYGTGVNPESGKVEGWYPVEANAIKDGGASGVAGSGSTNAGDRGPGAKAGGGMDISKGESDADSASAPGGDASARANALVATVMDKVDFGNRSPLRGFTAAIVPPETPQQEARRLDASEQAAARARHFMQNPPLYVRISLELTMLFLGDAGLIDDGVRFLGRKIVERRVAARVTMEGLERMCFGAGTPVWTERGLLAIEDIQPGDRVWRGTSRAEKKAGIRSRACSSHREKNCSS
ncbi:MAG: hypothetical protein HC927_02010 [Deltaproteobacteria bacterium]|nr:hypothetical protein [Deltaproteobacteria bacterium]